MFSVPDNSLPVCSRKPSRVLHFQHILQCRICIESKSLMWNWTGLWLSLIRSRILTMNFPVLLEQANRRGGCAIVLLSNISDVWYSIFPPRAFQKSASNGKMSNKYIKVKRCKQHSTPVTYQCVSMKYEENELSLLHIAHTWLISFSN